MKALGQTGLDFIAGKFKELKKLLSNKVDKVDGKGLSTNDYDSNAKAKVDAIPTNPKYTDTTYDLSKYAEKSDISRCKTKGYSSASKWGSVSSTRDLEDWIGDFDKRTREVETIKISSYITAYKYGRLVTMSIPSCDARNLIDGVSIPSSLSPVADMVTQAIPRGGIGCFLAITKREITIINIDNKDATIRVTISYIAQE